MNNPGDPNLRVPSLRSSFLGSWFRGQFLIFGIQGTLEAVDAIAKLMDLEIEKYESSDEDL